MRDVLKVVWVGTAPPKAEGLDWIEVADAPAAVAALDADPHLQAVVLRPARALAALGDLAEPDSPLTRRALLVWPETDDPEADAALYAAGIQEVLTDAVVGEVGGLARRVRAAIARKKVEQAAARAHSTDPFTGLVNRQQLVEHLSHLLAVRAREPAPIGVVVLRVGRPQPLEGTLARDAALLVRRKIGVRLRSGVRASDVVAALDADTFAVMLSAIESPSDARSVADKLALALRHPFPVAGQQVTVPVEVGFAVSPEDGREPEPLLRSAASRSLAGGFQPRAAANDP